MSSRGYFRIISWAMAFAGLMILAFLGFTIVDGRLLLWPGAIIFGGGLMLFAPLIRGEGEQDRRDDDCEDDL